MTTLTFKRSSRTGAARRRAGGLRSLVSLIGLLLLLASIIRELRLPAEQRTWHGRLFGKVPYDLRLPSPGRVTATMWNPAERRLLVPTVFGVGWTFNFAAAWATLQGAYAAVEAKS